MDMGLLQTEVRPILDEGAMWTDIVWRRAMMTLCKKSTSIEETTELARMLGLIEKDGPLACPIK